jgi:hypothetical protein
MAIIRLTGSISSLRFGGQPAALPQVKMRDFDVNAVPPACKVEMPDGSIMAVSRWSTPKRTRTYPFARVYDTYSHNGKVVTIIPVIKDEGRGQRRCDTNNDKINFITLSWMNLMNVYVVLAWYADADKENAYKVTNQRLDSEYVRNKLNEIATYKLDAHHWNNAHFRNEFVWVFRRAVQSYEAIAKRLGVQMHSAERHLRFLDTIVDPNNQNCLDLLRFRDVTLRMSRMAALRETETHHMLEELQQGTQKALIELKNNLGGVYTLTADEVYVGTDGIVIIQESKNSTDSILPSEDDIKDGLFKLVLYSCIDSLRINNVPVRFSTRLRLTGSVKGRLELPCEHQLVEAFCEQNHLGQRHTERMQWLNRESNALSIRIVVEGRDNGK